MKKLFTYFSIALMGLVGVASCNKPAENHAEFESQPIRVHVSIPMTRATGVVAQSGRQDSSDEAKVNDLQVFVFNGNSLDGYGHATNALSVTVPCTSGSRDIIAVVNAADLSAITSKPALMQQVSTLVNDPDNFQMIGSKTETLQVDGMVTVPVDRFAARVVIRGIKNQMDNAAQAADFKILSVYLTNVAGDVDFAKSSSYAVSNWYNKRGYQAANNLGDFTYDAVNQVVASGATNSTAHFFYSMPNAAAAAVGGPWSPRAARLVIKCEIAGIVYDYPITLPALESNKSYEIELVTITRPGNVDNGEEPDDSHPEDIDEENPIVGFNQGFEITVNDWTVVPVQGGTITI